METPIGISEYYANATVLVTGGTGYLGKALIEKILRSCPDVQRVYTLMRSKRNVSGADRLEKMKSSQIFDLLRSEKPHSLDKLHCMSGDISEPNLGLSPADRNILTKSVNIVFHSAATVRFNEPIVVALNTNVLGTRRLLDLCRDMECLRNMVHISTAYSNPSKFFVKEMVYESIKKVDLDWSIECGAALSNDLAVQVLQSIHGYFPNTYTMSKFMAEQLVQEYRSKYGLPLSIVRPSIISAALSEPFPGWADSVNGVNVFVIESGRGTLGTAQCNRNALMDLVPLDFVSTDEHTMCTRRLLELNSSSRQPMVIPWFAIIRPSDDMRVFNYTSGDRNGITWGTGCKLTLKHNRSYPSNYTMLYPACRLDNNYFIHRIVALFHTKLPAHVADIVLRIMGKPAVMVKIQRKVEAALKAEWYFLTNTWHYELGNVLEMLEASKNAWDHGQFEFDVRTVNWDTYVRDAVVGLQKYYLKVDMNGLPMARRKLKLLYAAWCMYYGFIYGLGLYIVCSSILWVYSSVL